VNCVKIESWICVAKTIKKRKWIYVALFCEHLTFNALRYGLHILAHIFSPPIHGAFFVLFAAISVPPTASFVLLAFSPLILAAALITNYTILASASLAFTRRRHLRL